MLHRSDKLFIESLSSVAMPILEDWKELRLRAWTELVGEGNMSWTRIVGVSIGFCKAIENREDSTWDVMTTNALEAKLYVCCRHKLSQQRVLQKSYLHQRYSNVTLFLRR